jgi:hypothetical protein
MFMGTMVISMSASGWLKKTWSLLTMYELSALLFIVGVLVLVPLFKGHNSIVNRSGEMSD